MKQIEMAAPVKVATNKQPDKDTFSFSMKENPTTFVIIPIIVLRDENPMPKVKILRIGGYMMNVWDKLEKNGSRREEAKRQAYAITKEEFELEGDDDDINAQLDKIYDDYFHIISLAIRDAGGNNYIKGSCPFAMVDEYDGLPPEKLLPFRIYVGLRSIVGQKEFGKVTHRFLAARKDGWPKTTSASGYSKDDWEHKTGHYLSNTRIRNAVAKLEWKWGLTSYYNGQRGTYYSFDLDNEGLIETILTWQGCSNKESLKLRKQAAEDAVYFKLYGKRKSEMEDEKKERRAMAKKENEQAPKQDNIPVAEPMSMPEPTPTPEPENPLITEWLKVAERLTEKFPNLAQTMKESLPTVKGQKAYIYVKNEAQKKYIEGSEGFIKTWAGIKSRAKMPDLMLRAEIDNNDDDDYNLPY